MRLQIVLLALPLAACVESGDPAEGGFLRGVSGIASGGYDERVAEREAEVSEAEARNTALRGEQRSLAARIAATEGALTDARFRLLRQRDAARNLDPGTRARVNAALVAEPGGGSDEARLADLQRLLSETRALSAELAALGA